MDYSLATALLAEDVERCLVKRRAERYNRP